MTSSSSPQARVDTAMDTAREALNEIRGHTRECDLRYQNIEASTARIEKAISDHAAEQRATTAALAKKQSEDNKAMYGVLWGVALGVAGAMFAVIMSLIFK